MNIKELKTRKPEDLNIVLGEQREKLRELRFRDANKQLKNVREIRVIKKTISRILTLLNVKETKKK